MSTSLFRVTILCEINESQFEITEPAVMEKVHAGQVASQGEAGS